ncbi:MAG: hypothetical protein ACRDIA_04930, partial [Actinomycetota bacterium]
MPSKRGGPAKATIKVLIADSQRLFSGALAIALSRRLGFEVSAERPASSAGLAEVIALEDPHVILLDLWLDQGNLIRKIEEEAPRSKVI